MGALEADGRVRVSSKFVEKFSEYADAAYFKDGRLMDAETFFAKDGKPERSLFDVVTRISTLDECDEEDEIAPRALGGNVRAFGAIYALLAVAKQTGIYRTLQTVFGHPGDQLLAMAMFEMLEPYATRAV